MRRGQLVRRDSPQIISTFHSDGGLGGHMHKQKHVHAEQMMLILFTHERVAFREVYYCRLWNRLTTPISRVIFLFPSEKEQSKNEQMTKPGYFVGGRYSSSNAFVTGYVWGHRWN